MSWIVKLRLGTGLVLTTYLVLHLTNHALGIFSFDALDAYRRPMAAVWRTWPTTVVLHGSLIVHFALALRTIFLKTTLRMSRWEASQLVIGVLGAPALLAHVTMTRINDAVLGVASSGHLAFLSHVNDAPVLGGALMVSLVLFMWTHVVLGLHFWLRIRHGYQRVGPVLFALAVLLPVLALLGFARSWMSLHEVSPERLQAATAAWTAAPAGHRALIGGAAQRLAPALCFGFVGLTLLLRWHRLRTLKRRNGYQIQHPSRGTLSTIGGRTVLEALRDAGVPHAAVCGGRGRCTTCRIHVDRGADDLPPPGESERAALARVTKDPQVRLACMVRPTADVAITPMLPASATARDALARGGVSGREQIITAMFIDLRDSTKLGEQRLPYDVVFILNQFFAEMSDALDMTRGHYAQFSGDGLLALYGLDGTAEDGARDALRGVADMKRRLAALNARLAYDLKTPLRIGIGLHTGEAIVGTMGPPASPNLSAIGDNINIAARLEAKCKELGCDVIVSEQTASTAGIDLSAHPVHTVEVRGRAEPVTIFATCDVADFGV